MEEGLSLLLPGGAKQSPLLPPAPVAAFSGAQQGAVSADEFAALLAPLGPFGPKPLLAVGVSGGPHSLALAVLAQAWVRRRGGVVLGLVVDHGLRSGSAAEAAAVAATLRGFGITARILTLSLAPASHAVQERARAGRMAALLHACAETGALHLLLGHHRADQAETVLLRAAAGSGIDGLAGMPVLRATAEAVILRPLLGCAPARLEAVVAQAGLDPVRDPSNLSDRFARVRVRKELADPAGQGAPLGVLARAAAVLGARRRAEEQAAAERCAASVVLYPEGYCSIQLDILGRDSLAERVLGQLLRMVAGATFAPAQSAVAALLRQGQGSLHGALLRPGPRGAALLLREPVAAMQAAPAYAGQLWDGRFRVCGTLPRVGDEVCHVAALGAATRPGQGAGIAIPASVAQGLPGLFLGGNLLRRLPLAQASCARETVSPTTCWAAFAPAAGPAFTAFTPLSPDGDTRA